MVDTAESSGPVDRLFHLLLAMTGRVDDDAINSTRELLGTGQPDAAAEFLAGCLVAGRIPVSATEQYDLRRVLDDLRSPHSLADRLHVVDSVPDEGHRFGDSDESDAALVEALAPVAGRLSGVRALWCAWRMTPAGVTYGAVPRRVLLAEVGAEGSVAAVGYQLLEALRRAHIACSVDVFSSDTQLPEYHRNALSTAYRVHLNMPTPVMSQNGTPRARAPRSATVSGESAGAGGGHDLRGESPAQERWSEPEPARPERPRPEQASPEPPRPAPPTPARQADTPPAGIPAAARTELAPVRQSEVDSSNNMRVPAAVDAKLTDRERNLLRKLHEELAQREQDRDGVGRAAARRAVQAESRSALPGTGGFPPISAASATYHGHGDHQTHQPG